MMANPFYDLPPELQAALMEKSGGISMYIPKRTKRPLDEIERTIKEYGGVKMAAMSLSVSRQAVYQRIRRK